MELSIEEKQMNIDRKSKLMAWVVCLSASLFFFYEFIQGNMFASIADEIMLDFGIQASQMTYLSSVYYLSTVLFLFVAGYVLDHYSTKKTLLTVMLLCVISSFLLAYTDSYALALLSRFVMGIGSAFCFLGPIRIASRWFQARQMALVTGVIVTMAMSGGMLAQYPLTELVLQLGWRTAQVYISWFGLLMMFFMFYVVQDGPEPMDDEDFEEGPSNFLTLMKTAYFNSQTLCAAIYTSLMNMAVAVFGAMMGSLYLMQRMGIEKTEASLINTMLFLGAILGGPLIGFFSDKLGRRLLPMRISVLLSLLLMLAILYLPLSSIGMGVAFFALGFFTAAQVISYALVAESTSPRITATALSMISILTQGGYLVYQNLFSFILTWHGGMRMVNGVPVYSLNDYQTAALILPAGLLIAAIMLLRLKETCCKHLPGTL